MKTPHRVLMIVTSHARLGATNTKTGFWLEELAGPYLELKTQAAHIDLASPAGGRPEADPKSTSDANATVRAFLNDEEATAKLSATLRVADIQTAYDAYFVVGGHGAMWDLAEDAAVQALLASAWESGKVVGAVCHGPAALVNVRLRDGSYLVAGKRVSAFSNAEERAVGLDQIVPFALETRLRECGARYESGPMWSSFAVTDGKLVTGQNPASSLAVARAVLAALA
jgi:putative intracellular protease/amidase